jgi:dolichol-phosphate mannosyltransferase
LWRWLKFNAVGAIGVCLQLGVLAMLRAGLHWGYLQSTAVAVEVTVMHNFLWHERFTWADRPAKARVERFAAFNCSNGLISLAGNLVVMKLLVGGLGINYFAANGIGIAVCSLANFAVGDQFVFTAEAQRP